MKRNVNSPAPWFLARHAPEVYCRRDNRVYDSCPNTNGFGVCPCLHGVETADGQVEQDPPEDTPAQ